MNVLHNAGATAFNGSYFGEGVDVHLSNINCTGNEDELINCPSGKSKKICMLNAGVACGGCAIIGIMPILGHHAVDNLQWGGQEDPSTP